MVVDELFLSDDDEAKEPQAASTCERGSGYAGVGRSAIAAAH